MAKRDRQLERLRRSKTDVGPEAVRTVLVRYGFVVQSVSGSHWVYNHEDLAELLVIPYRRPLLPIYVQAAIDAIDEVLKREDA